MPNQDQPAPLDIGEVLQKHILDEENVLKELRAWQQKLDAKVDSIAAELSRNTAVCDEMRHYQIAGRVVSSVFKWTGAMAMAAGGMIGLWVAIKTAFGVSPPGPQ